jgi:FixJ family two-component response regulator
VSGAEHSYLYARAHRQLWDFFDAFLSTFKVTDFESDRTLRRLGMLTPREREVLLPVCRGCTQGPAVPERSHLNIITRQDSRSAR